MELQCYKCKEILPASAFSKRKIEKLKKKKDPVCKECIRKESSSPYFNNRGLRASKNIHDAGAKSKQNATASAKARSNEFGKSAKILSPIKEAKSEVLSCANRCSLFARITTIIPCLPRRNLVTPCRWVRLTPRGHWPQPSQRAWQETYQLKYHQPNLLISLATT